jgi:hypothetical protein
MNLRFYYFLVFCGLVAVVLPGQDAKPPAAAPTTITDSQRIEFLKARANLADFRTQIAQAQAQAEGMQRALQAQYDAMAKTCKTTEQFDPDALACKTPPPPAPPKK